MRIAVPWLSWPALHAISRRCGLTRRLSLTVTSVLEDLFGRELDASFAVADQPPGPCKLPFDSRDIPQPRIDQPDLVYAVALVLFASVSVREACADHAITVC